MIYLLVMITVLLGGGSLALFALFLFWGPLDLVNLGFGTAATLWFDAGLSLAFFVQHSVMIRKSFHQRLRRLLPEKYHGVLFTLAAGIFLLAVVIFWQELDYRLLTLTGGLRWLARLVFFLGLAGFFWGATSLGFFDPFGLLSLLSEGQDSEQPQVLVQRGPYRWVRHPLYFCTILLIWSCPDLTADRLLFNILWTAWIVIGARLEERDLIDTFGQAYLDYRQKVPMLLPGCPAPSPSPK